VRIKHPRIHHLPWSEDRDEDDLSLDDLGIFKNQEVVVTLKLDGENSSLYTDYIHARSLDSVSHPSQSWVRQLQSQIGYNIPKDWRICGENVYAKHSIYYKNLSTYFYVHSIWNDKNECISWDDTLTWAKLLELETVPLLYRGIFDVGKIKSLFAKLEGENEGYVIRLAKSFSYNDFTKCVGKYRRANHVTSSTHWKHEKIINNKLKIDSSGS